jgi:hypothetical protein
MPRDFEIADIPTDQQPLFDALFELGIPNRRLIQTVERLIEPPESLQVPSSEHTEAMNSVLEVIDPFNGDMAARMLRLEETGQAEPGATWKALTAAERKRAKRLWTWARDTGFDTAPQGRSPKVDSALVVYLARALAEVCDKPDFTFSRPMNGGPPRGPMWRALMAALPLAERYLAWLDGQFAREPRKFSQHAETIAEILSASCRRSKRFAEFCSQHLLGPCPNDVAEHPAMFRAAVLHARRSRQRKRRVKSSVP